MASATSNEKIERWLYPSTLERLTGVSVPSAKNTIFELSGKDIANGDTLKKVLVAYANYYEANAQYETAGNSWRWGAKVSSDQYEKLEKVYENSREEYLKIKSDICISEHKKEITKDFWMYQDEPKFL